MIKTSKKLIATALVLCMVLAMLPVGVLAAASPAASEAVTLDYGIVHLDCGRKYFGVESIKAIIDATAEAGMNYVQLAIGNDGLRFLLDDMKLEFGSYTFSSDAVKNAIHVGNENYHNFDVDELTQAEMDTIIDYAKKKSVGIIPLINTPGHMDAILDAGESLTGQTLSYNGSGRTIDVTNALAVEFTQKLLQLYIDYFAGKGCTIFNMGADEYANDIYSGGGMGFGQLQTYGQYGQFVEYVNEVAAMIKTANMKPMAFNDGIYYNSSTSYGTFDQDIIIQYWSSGWSGYNLASASYLAGKGHDMVNANGDYYYVVGKDDAYHVKTGGQGYYHAFNSADKAGEYNVNTFSGGTVSDPVGAAYLIWCDYPGVETEAQVVANNQQIIPVFGATLPALKAAVWNGSDTTEPEVPTENTLEDATTGIAVTGSGLTGLTVTSVENPSFQVPGYALLAAYDIQPVGISSGTVTVPNQTPGKQITVFDDAYNIVGVYTVAENGTVTFEASHFSVYYLGEKVAEENGTVDVVLQVGQSMTYTDTAGVYNSYTGDLGGKAQIQLVEGIPGTTVGTENATSLTDGKYVFYNVRAGKYLTNQYYEPYLQIDQSDPAQATVWMVEAVNGGYYVTDGQGNYLTVGNGSSALSTSATVVNLSSTNEGYWGISQQVYWDVYYLNHFGGSNSTNAGGWTDGPESDAGSRWYIYPVTENPGGTNITFTGVLPTEEAVSVQVGNVTYNIIVQARSGAYTQWVQLAGTASLTKHTVLEGETVSYAVTSGEGVASVDENGVVTGLANGEATVAVTVKKGDVVVANYTYTVTVSDAAPDGAMTGDTLEIEWWITNSTVREEQYDTAANSVTIQAADAATQEGIDVSTLSPYTAYSNFDGWIELKYWQTMRMNSENHQTGDTGDDETADGTRLTHIRYFNNAWQYKTADGQWHYFMSGDQAVAYYMRHTQLTQDVTTAVKDWGYVIEEGSSTPDLSNHEGQAALMVGVVYPDGTMHPAEGELLLNATNVFNYWENRSIGIIAPITNADYTISKITYVRGTRTNDTNSNIWDSNASVEWDKVTINDVEYYDETEAWNKSEGTEPVINGTTEGIYFEAKNTAVLVLIYLEPVIKDTNLTVEYYDVTNGRPIGSYQVVMEGENHSFRQDLLGNTAAIPTDEAVFALDDTAYVTNKFGNNQTFSKDLMNADLTDMEEVYRSGMYGYENAQILDDGMTLRLNYILKEGVVTDPTYVVDFGLKVNFPLSDVIAPPTGYQGDFAAYVRQYVESVTLYSNPSYGDITISDDFLTITYTPTRILGNLDIAMLRINMADNKTIIAQVGFMPATTVYYEEGFATFGNGWTPAGGGSWSGNTGLSAYTWHQTVVKYTKGDDGYLYATGEGSNYGFDSIYQNGAQHTQATTSTKGDSLQFTFRGTGIDLFANCTSGSGNIGVKITKDGKIVKLAAIALKHDGAYAVDPYAVTEAKGTPVLSILNMGYGEYTVTMIVTSDTGSFTFDGFRVYNTINPTTSEDETTQTYHAYNSAGEAHPYFFDLRDQVLVGLNVANYTGNYADQIAKTLYSQVYQDIGGTAPYAVVLDNSGKFNDADLKTLLEQGPKNELYLAPGQSVSFKLDANVVSAQIGMHSVDGSAVSYKINEAEGSLSHTVDMFYELALTGERVITIQNVGGGVLSLGDVKLFLPDEAVNPTAFAALTAEDFGIALMSLGFEESFQPEISMKWLDDSVKVGLRAILQITTGTDVESLTVNGEALRYVELRGVRIWTYSVRNAEAGTYTYDVEAFDANGNASEIMQTPELTVTRSVLLDFLKRFFG